MHRILNFVLLLGIVLSWSCNQVTCAPWLSHYQQPQQHQQSFSNSGFWGNQQPNKPQKYNPQKPPSGGCNTGFSNKPAFSQPFGPAQLPNQEVVKPVFSAWPRPSHLINNQLQLNPPSQQQQQGQSGGWSSPNEQLLKPVFSAWPSKQKKRPLVDVPFTVELVPNSQNNGGWRK